MPFDAQNFETADSILERLISGRATVAHKWSKRWLHNSETGGHCARGALMGDYLARANGVFPDFQWSADIVGQQAEAYLAAELPPNWRDQKNSGFVFDNRLPFYNNDPWTTQADIIALYDRAIAARQRDAAWKPKALLTNEMGARDPRERT